MKKLVFADSWQEKFAAAGLKSYEDFQSIADRGRPDDRIKRSATAFSIEANGSRIELYIKCFYCCQILDILFSLQHFKSLLSQAYFEWYNANLLLANGIETYQPLCYGEMTVLGFEKMSFVVTKKLNGQPLSVFVKQNWHKLPQSEKEKIIISVAKLVRKAHDAGISLTDLYLWHIFIEQGGDGQYEFSVIDLHRMEHNVKSINKKAENLGRLIFSMRGEYFDDKIRQLLIESYAGKNPPASMAALVRIIEKHKNHRLYRRKPKTY